MVHRKRGRVGRRNRTLYPLWRAVTAGTTCWQRVRLGLWQRRLCVHAFRRTAGPAPEVPGLARRPGTELYARPSVAWPCEFPLNPSARWLSLRWTANPRADVAFYFRIRERTAGNRSSAFHATTPHGSAYFGDDLRAN